MSEACEIFLSYLDPEARILDLGCGSGRDSRYFLDQGYKVTSVDGSVKLCAIDSICMNNNDNTKTIFFIRCFQDIQEHPSPLASL